ILLMVSGGCRRHSETNNSLPSVTISHPISKPVTENLDLTGTVGASLSVNLVARVTGYLESVNFKDGDYVEKDQLLFVIEPKPYEAQVALAKINLGYTRVTAPFAGRIGRRQVDPGNLVGAGGATTLAKLEQMAPI